MTIDEKLSALRKVMTDSNIHAVIIPSSDPHQSEYIADCWKDREWISGFNGSSGIVVITQSHAGLWVDSRYYLQGEMQIKGSSYTLHKIVNQFVPEHLDWLLEHLNVGDNLAIDGEDFSLAQVESMEKKLNAKNINIVNRDLISLVWQDRPTLPTNKVIEHLPPYINKLRSEKFKNIRAELEKEDVDALIISMLDEIAWLFNMRGNDVKYNPVVVSYAIIEKDKAILFADESKFEESLLKKLKEDNIIIMPYNDIIRYLNEASESSTFMIDANTINYTLAKACNAKLRKKDSPVKIAKGIKDAVEIKNFESAMIDDGIALANAFYSMEKTITSNTISEFELGEKIAEARKHSKDYVGESFGPIIGYKGNGAIVHYSAEKETCFDISNEGVLLVDCGGQYLTGTTDITRTFALGKVNEEIKKHYTLVLKGHLALSMIKFPRGTSGATIDVLARQYLWEEGLNYLHGTGHGVGYFLNVHEGPHGFAAPTTERGRTPLQPGMIITNEPGIYITNSHGIRIENILVVKESKFEGFLEFETLTYYPYDFNLIDERMLTSKEKAWINKYHKLVFDKIGPHLSNDVREWFHYKCKMFG